MLLTYLPYLIEGGAVDKEVEPVGDHLPVLQVVHQYTGAGDHVAGQGHGEGLLHRVHLQRVAHHDVSLSDDEVVDAVHPAVSADREDHVLVHLHVWRIFFFY